MKKYSSLVIKFMKIETTIRCQYVFTRITKFLKADMSEYQKAFIAIGTVIYWRQVCKTVTNSLENPLAISFKFVIAL